MADVTLAQITDWIGRAKDSIAENRDHLTALDSAIGDADHGSNLTRGFNAVVEKLTASPPATIAALLQSSGMTLVSTVGGASGPLVRHLAAPHGQDDRRDGHGDGHPARRGICAPASTGSSPAARPSSATRPWSTPSTQPSPRTRPRSRTAMTPPRLPRRRPWRRPQGRDATEPLVARKGRASYLGERSAGHIDPGSASTTLLLEALAAALQEG